MDAFQEHTLGPEANEYVRDVLESGRSLALHLRRSHDLTEGKVVTRLAPDANTDELGKFEWGGKYYPEPVSGRRRTPEDDLASYILGYLEADEERVCVFENYLARSTDPWLERAESRVLFLGEEVYHVISAEVVNPSLAKVTINEADYYPVFIGILSRWPEGSHLSPERRDTANEELRALAEKAEKIIVSAYDGEGYLIWGSRRPQASS
jgi:hypothetical protein